MSKLLVLLVTLSGCAAGEPVYYMMHMPVDGAGVYYVGRSQGAITILPPEHRTDASLDFTLWMSAPAYGVDMTLAIPYAQLSTDPSVVYPPFNNWLVVLEHGDRCQTWHGSTQFQVGDHWRVEMNIRCTEPGKDIQVSGILSADPIRTGEVEIGIAQ